MYDLQQPKLEENFSRKSNFSMPFHRKEAEMLLDCQAGVKYYFLQMEQSIHEPIEGFGCLNLSKCDCTNQRENCIRTDMTEKLTLGLVEKLDHFIY